MIEPDQIRAARGMLDWSQTQLADAAGVSLGVVKKAEDEGRDVRVSSLRAIEIALDKAGIVFLDAGDSRPGGRGVRLRP